MENKQPKKLFRKNSSTKDEYFKNKKLYKKKGNIIGYMEYRIVGNSIENIKLFGINFVKTNKNKCKIIIAEKEYRIVDEFDCFEKYEIKNEDETLKVILDGENIEDISYMFFDCINLIKVNLFNIQNVTNMSNIFCGCENLIEVGLSSLKTYNVTNMACMFMNCKNLIKIDLSSFVTQNVTDMSNMFNGCKNLIKVDLSSFNTQNVTNIESMFKNCESLSKIDLLSFNSQFVIYMAWMFSGCRALIKIKRKNCIRCIKYKTTLRLGESRLSIIEI